jgi:hypothetical protein
VAEGQKFCPECGASLDSAPPTELESSKSREAESGDCGVCGTPIEEGSQFCFECGSSVDQSKMVQKPEPIPIVPPGNADDSAGEGAAAGFLGALWGGSASCGCGCFSLILIFGLLLIAGAFL